MRAVLLMLLSLSGNAFCAVNTFQLSEVVFSDGGRAQGWVTFSDQIAVDYDLRVSGGMLSSMGYTPANSEVAWVVESSGEPTAYIANPTRYDWTRQIDLLLPVDARDARPGDSFDWITTPVTAHHALSSEVDILGRVRFVVSGSGVVLPIPAAAVPEPETYAWGMAAVLIVHCIKRRRRLTAAK